ncbi:MAG: hypothetical protein U0841_23255 [Chloroflexia bacterium]
MPGSFARASTRPRRQSRRPGRSHLDNTDRSLALPSPHPTDAPPSPTPQPTSTPPDPDTAAQHRALSLPAGWKIYTGDVLPFAIAYRKWTVEEHPAENYVVFQSPDANVG